jgi:hypothetical protein
VEEPTVLTETTYKGREVYSSYKGSRAYGHKMNRAYEANELEGQA